MVRADMGWGLLWGGGVRGAEQGMGGSALFLKGRAAAGAGRSAGWGIGGRDSAVRSIPLRSISLTGFALWEYANTERLMCEHNGAPCSHIPALLIACVQKTTCNIERTSFIM